MWISKKKYKDAETKEHLKQAILKFIEQTIESPLQESSVQILPAMVAELRELLQD